MPNWVRFRNGSGEGFGTWDGDVIAVHEGCMFDGSRPTGAVVAAADVSLLPPTQPSKLIALWNNFHALADKLKIAAPEEPLYLIKSPSSCLEPGGTTRRPPHYDGRVVFEGELGIVIRKTCRNVSVDEAEAFILGYTCVNDITAADLIHKDASFAQWTRSKSFDGFGPFGPAIATDFNWRDAVVRTELNGAERQHYPISDMVFSPPELVSLISRDVTLLPGDVICCGTSIGVGVMKGERDTVRVSIDGIGTLETTFAQ